MHSTQNKENTKQNPRHLRIITMLREAKEAAGDNKDMPHTSSSCPLIRARAVANVQYSPTAYMVKDSGEIIIDRNNDDYLSQNPNLLTLGKDPLSHMPVTINQRLKFREELKVVSHAFLQRLEDKKLKNNKFLESNNNKEVSNAFKP